MSTVQAVDTPDASTESHSVEDEVLLIFARLMEGGKEDDETCGDLDQLTRLLNQDAEAASAATSASSSTTFSPLCQLIDMDCVDTILSYLDIRQPHSVRGRALLTTSAYLRAAGEQGHKNLSSFFLDRVRRGTYDDYIAAFCVAAATFPLVPDLMSDLFLAEGFLPSLSPLMRRRWKSRKVETACLEMLNAACMNSHCREAVAKFCAGWLEEIVNQDPTAATPPVAASTSPDTFTSPNPESLHRHSEQAQSLAAIILTKLRAGQPSKSPMSTSNTSHEKVPTETTVEEISSIFTRLLLDTREKPPDLLIEGLAYASLRPKVKFSIANDPSVLGKLVESLAEAPPRSSTTFGALTIFVNLTRYQPTISDEEARVEQLKAYANAAAKPGDPDPLDGDKQVANRCKAVFDAGLVPVLVTNSKNGSVTSLSHIASIINSLSVTPSLRGQLAQQGAVRLLVNSWSSIPEDDRVGRRTAAQALARILISIDPSLAFGGNRSTPLPSAVRPLVSILTPDPSSETRDLLPTFEALMALTNIASVEDPDARRTIIRAAWSDIEEQLLSTNVRVFRAAVELVCNLVQAPEAAVLYADGGPQAASRLHVLVALTDSEDEGTRSAAGGALATLTAHKPVAAALLRRDRGVKIVLGLCQEESEDLRHRGVFIINNLLGIDGEVGELARERVQAAGGVNALKECAKKSRRPEVLELTSQALKMLVEPK